MQRWATFDCYGTLIDWDRGLRAELARVFGDDRADDQLARYHELERELERDGTLSYREVLTGAMRRLGATAGTEHALADSVSGWAAFPEVRRSLETLRGRGWKLGLLSNSDDEFIAASQVQIGVPFDEVVVAQEIGSYKPSHRHWEEFFARTRAAPGGHVHVAASLFHDIVPAGELDLRTVWVNRLAEQPPPGVRVDRELVDLEPLPPVLDELVPGG